ncbi:MAG: zinc chelation protein SecC [Sulfurimonas sp.]|jgi:SEC-C motif-containing protein|nr:zinc chelation protein SecC [Sulfurimonas sp.]MBU3938552.1 YchJ family protein [bacterium]MBU4024619.1 YchJ family protein [bacterium]MBU4059612.1 YchJ family protein [bacterium]MBU4110063.1 YchJ family protein [bacterium]
MKCFCGSNEDFNECCGAIIDATKKASTPEELMRSRYSAYVQGNGRYLVLSASKESRYDEDVELIEEFSNSVKWLGLQVLNATDEFVEFKAFYKDAEGIKVLHEKSRFVLEDGFWLYADGTLYNTKVQRNDSCPCQSGKKYKKCCGI